MQIYKLASIGMSLLLLFGCTAFSASKEEPSSKEVSNNEVEESAEVTKKEPVILDVSEMDPFLRPDALVINDEITSLMGENKSYFSYSDDRPFKLALSNTGTQSFLFKIKNVDKGTIVTNGVLNSKESYEKIFDGFPEGDYVISSLIEEEGDPGDIQLKVKLEVLPYITR